MLWKNVTNEKVDNQPPTQTKQETIASNIRSMECKQTHE